MPKTTPTAVYGDTVSRLQKAGRLAPALLNVLLKNLASLVMAIAGRTGSSFNVPSRWRYNGMPPVNWTVERRAVTDNVIYTGVVHWTVDPQGG